MKTESLDNNFFAGCFEIQKNWILHEKAWRHPQKLLPPIGTQFFAEERKSFGGKMMKYFALTTLSQNNDWFLDMKHLTLIGAKQTFL